MKTQSNDMPLAFLNLGNGRWHYNFNINETTDEEGRPQFEYDTLVVQGSPTYHKVVDTVIEHCYRKDEEIALINNYLAYQAAEGENREEKHLSKYLQYRSFVAGVKTAVRADCRANGIPTE